jgi:hypothetical protein
MNCSTIDTTLTRTTMLLMLVTASVFGQRNSDDALPVGHLRRPCEAIPVKATLARQPREVPPFFYGHNVNLTASGISWHEPGLVEAVRCLSPGVLRYPGGTITNYWDWKTGWFPIPCDVAPS